MHSDGQCVRGKACCVGEEGCSNARRRCDPEASAQARRSDRESRSKSASQLASYEGTCCCLVAPAEGMWAVLECLEQQMVQQVVSRV